MRCGTWLTGMPLLTLAIACGPRVPPAGPPRTIPAVVPVCPPPARPEPPPPPAPSIEACGDPATSDQSAGSPDDTVTADPAVTFVSTGGYWESGRARGVYRVVVKTYCGEHCTEQVLLEQIRQSLTLPDKIRSAVPVPETAPLRVEGVDFWPSGKWTGEIEFRLTDEDSKQPSRLCLRVRDEKNTARSGPCAR